MSLFCGSGKKLNMENYICLLLCSALLHSARSVTDQQATAARVACDNLLPRRSANIAGFVRVAFHDCIGGCDGCIDLNQPDNNGLQPYLIALNDAYAPISSSMSRADFWATCAAAAVSRGHANSGRGGEFSVVVRYGRPDAQNCIGNPPQRTFPNALEGLASLRAFFLANFNYNDRQIVALLGAHSLGRARPENSGFDGRWVRNEFSLDNAYYIDLLRGWRQVQLVDFNSASRWQWERRNEIMLNSDMCLAYDINPDANGRVDSERLPRNGDDSVLTTKSVREFAGDNNLWLQEFRQVFLDMISRTTDGSTLQDVTVGVNPPPVLNPSPVVNPTPVVNPPPVGDGNPAPPPSQRPPRPPQNPGPSGGPGGKPGPRPSGGPPRRRRAGGSGRG